MENIPAVPVSHSLVQPGWEQTHCSRCYVEASSLFPLNLEGCLSFGCYLEAQIVILSWNEFLSLFFSPFSTASYWYFFVLVKKQNKTEDSCFGQLPPALHPPPHHPSRAKANIQDFLSHRILQVTALTTVKWNQSVPWCLLVPQWSHSALPFLLIFKK